MRNRMYSTFLSPKAKLLSALGVATLMGGVSFAKSKTETTKKKPPEFNHIPNCSPEYDYDQDTLDALYGKCLLPEYNPNYKPKAWKLRSLSQNVDDHPGFRFPDHPTLGWVSHSFPELSFENRFPLYEVFYHTEIHARSVNLFVLQEMGDNAKELFQTFFEKEGFACITAKYNLHDGSCNFMIAYKKSDYNVEKIDQIYFTKTGRSLTNEQRESMTREQKLDHNFLIEFERSAQVVTLSQTKKQNEEIMVINTHPGLINEHKLMAVEALCSHLKNETIPMLIMGDFNLFDTRDNKNGEQVIFKELIHVLEKNGYTWSSKNVAEKGMKSTFIYHPFDILKFFTPGDRETFEKLKKEKNYSGMRELCFRIAKRCNVIFVCGNLDAIFSKNLKSESAQVTPFLFFNERVINTLYTTQEKFHQSYSEGLFKKSSDKPKPQIVSDHLALETEIEVTEDKPISMFKK